MGNIELLSKAMDRILVDPTKHDQNSWISRKYDEYGGVCGTTMCLAGHTAIEAGAQMPPVLNPHWDGDWYLNSEGKFAEFDDGWDENGFDINKAKEISLWASDKLGLTYEEREYLFYCFGDADELKRRVHNVIEAWEKGETFIPDYMEEED